jgi:hypothetical protein
VDVRLAALSALVVVLVIIAGALGVMYSSLASKYASLKSSYNSVSSSYSSLKGQYESLNGSYASLEGEYEKLSSAYSTLYSEYKNQQVDVVLAAAMSHWNDIAIENVSLVAPQYLPNATLKWVGGPLSGTYSGISSIESVWNKFFNMYETVYWYTIIPPSVVMVSPGVYKAVGYVQFLVAPTAAPINVFVLNVTEVLTYVNTSSGYEIESEVWEVKPLPLTDVIAGYPGQEALAEDAVLADAMSHWNDIAIENASLIISEYAPNATLHWIGGPLSGNYTGIAAINATWTKFDSLYEYVVWYALVPPTVQVKGDTAMAKAPLQFVVFPFPTASNPHPQEFVLNVTEILYYNYNATAMQWQIVNEYWIVHPLPISDVAPGYTPGQYQG